MIDLKISKDGENVTAQYLLKPNDRIDNLTLGMMVNNDIKGFVPVAPIQADSERYFKYDISGLVTLKEYLSGYVKKEKLLKAFYSISEIIKESTDYMINWTSFSLDMNEVYVDEKTTECKLLCMPLLTVINDGNLCNFFKMILFSAQFDTSENSDYIGKLINFLNPVTFTLDKFMYELEEMLGLEHKKEEMVSDKPETEAMNQEQETQVLESTNQEPETQVSESKEEAAEEPKEEEAAEEVIEAEEEKEEAEDKTEVEKAEEEKIEEVIVTPETGMNDDMEDDENILAVPMMTKEELESAEVEKNFSTETEVKTLSPIEELMGAGVVENNNEDEEKLQEENEEIEEEISLETLPYLQKTRNGDDKIPINKDKFYVGKAPDVDYQILDDPMVEDKPAYIVKHDDNYYLVDNNSPMGIYMNETMLPVEEEVLIPEGAKIKFGEYDYIFSYNKQD